MENCPACNRKLMSHISPRCNWCGHEIQDAAYLAEAEIRRIAHQQEEAQHAAQSLQWFQSTVDAYAPGGMGLNVPFARRPRTDMAHDVQRRMQAEAAIIAEAARARKVQEAVAAQAERERQEQLREQAAAAKEAADDRFNHLEL